MSDRLRLAAASRRFWDPLTEREKGNVEAWLGFINHKEVLLFFLFPIFFRVFFFAVRSGD